MERKKVWKGIVGMLSATALVGCVAEGAALTDATPLAGDEPASPADEAIAEIGGTTQALGNFSHHMPRRGSEEDIIETVFLGYGMMYELSLRTGVLVDAITASFYEPSNPNNQHTPGDRVFARGPAGGTAGSAQPKLVCPGGYAARFTVSCM